MGIGEKMTIRVVAREKIISGKRDEVIEKFLTEMVDTTRKEKGCISYDYHVDVDDADVFAMIETWETMEDLQAHLKSEHFQRIIPQVGEYLSEKTRLEIYELIL